MFDTADLPDDVAALKAMLIAARLSEMAKDVAIARKDERIERLEKLVAAFKQAAFGRKSEKTDPDQFDLALEDLETAMTVIHAEDEADAPAGNRIAKPHAINRGSLPKHLPRIEEVIEPERQISAIHTPPSPFFKLNASCASENCDAIIVFRSFPARKMHQKTITAVLIPRRITA